MKPLVKNILATVLAFGAMPWANAGVPSLTEGDYFGDFPVVLSVSRLAQPLDETPGAVTVIDRETVRRLGARDVYDVLRVVPGFLVSGWNGASPFASYHNVLDQFGSKLQVFVDGRSVYSTYYLGGTQRGLQGVILEDVERIEVLRGSNSAAYGANAFLGVVNIVTRHTADTRGALFSVTRGEGEIGDNSVRYGWGSDDASFRATLAHRSDAGLAGVADDSRIGQLHLRADLRPTATDEVMLQAGAQRDSWGDGNGSYGNPLRTVSMRNWFAQGEWRRSLGAGEELTFSFSHDDEDFRDRVPYTKPGAIYRGVFLDWSGKASRTQLEFQHSLAPAAAWRAVWGSTWREERVWSPPLYYGRDWIVSRQLRLFGNVEWRPHARWLVNAGAMWEQATFGGADLSPRLMVNFHAAPGHTMRAGITQSRRVPTTFEKEADVRYFNGAGQLAGWTWDARGGVQPERIRVKEIGYLGEMRPLGLSLDVRGYREMVTDRVVSEAYSNGTLPVTDKTNTPARTLMRGWEYQLRWQPAAGTRIWWSHMSTRTVVTQNPFLTPDVNGYTSPNHMDSLTLFQSLPGEVDLTVTYAEMSAMVWNALGDAMPPQHRVDVRVAKRFRVGATRAEAALAVQAASGDYLEFLPGRVFGRRAFATLRLEY